MLKLFLQNTIIFLLFSTNFYGEISYSDEQFVSNNYVKFYRSDKTAGIDQLGNLGHNSIWIDLDSDGCQDLFATVTDLRNPPFAYLFRNKCDGSFELLTSNSGIKTDMRLLVASSAGDFDNDGLVDLLLGMSSYNSTPILYKNIGQGYFLDYTPFANFHWEAISRNVSFVDFNTDGFLDIFQLTGDRVVLYNNSRDGIFEDITHETTLPLVLKGTSSALWFDYNADMLPDILILREGPNLLFENKGNNVFKNISITSGLMGNKKWDSPAACAGDIDNDGDLDVFVVNIGSKRNALYINNSDGSFSDITIKSGIRGIGDGRTCSMVDYNSDGLVDIFTTNHVHPSRMYKNLGNLRFRDVARSLNITEPIDAFTSTWGDYNGDAILDFFVNGHFGNAIFEGHNLNNSVVVELIGNGKTVNTSAIGSKAELRTESKNQIRYVVGGKGCCENDMLPLHFGLGQETAFSLTVTWTNKSVCNYSNLNAGEKRFYKVYQQNCHIDSY